MMSRLLILTFVIVGVKCQTCPYRDYGVITGDVTLGFMFSYLSPYFHGDICSQTIPDYSAIQLVEAAIHAVNRANENNSVPGVTIGLEAWDSCYSATVATDRSISFLGDRKVSYEQNVGDNCGSQLKAAMIADLRGERGPAVASLLSDAKSPVISYAATIPSLTPSSGYDFLSRVVPPDSAEAKAIIGLLVSQGWQYISLVYSDTAEDQAEAKAFQDEARNAKICISYTKVINSDASQDEIITAVSEVGQQSPTIIVAFLSSMSFLSEFGQQISESSRFHFVVGHRLLPDLLKPNSFSLNLMAVSPSTLDLTIVSPFDEYFKGLSPDNVNTDANLWFRSFWQQSYQCQIGFTCGPGQVLQHQQNYRRNLYVSSVIESVNTVVEALRNLQVKKCSGFPGPCESFMTTTPKEIQEEIRQTVFSTGSQPSNFSGMGSPASEDYFIWRIDTTNGAQTKLGQSLSGQTSFETDNGLDSITSSCGNPCMDPVCLKDDDELTVLIDGDVLLAGFFSVNEWDADAMTCGALSLEGVLRLEAMLYAINQINQDPNILPTVSLGLDGLNTCGDSQRASHQALKLVSEFEFGQSGSGSRVDDGDQKQHLYGIVGPGGNEESAAVVSVVKTYGVTVVSYEADSHLLSSSSSVPNFARVVPTYISTLFPVAATLAEWNFLYVSTLLSSKNYPLNTIIRSYFEQYDVCVAQSLQIPSDDSGWDAIFDDLSSKPEAKAIFISAGPEEIQRFMGQIKMRNLTGQYFLIADDSWVLDDDFTSLYEDVARGTLAVKTSPRQYNTFQRYVAGLDPATNSQNPWFRKFWMQKFSCNLPGEPSEFMSPCLGNEALDPNTDVNDETLAYVIDAVYTLAEALHRIHSTRCGSLYVGVCEAMDILSGDEVFSEVISETFQSKNEDGLSIDFSFSGDGTVPLHIFNIQQSGPVEVGMFERFQFLKTQAAVFYTSDGSIRNTGIYSVCNETQCLECEENGRDSVATSSSSGDIWIGGFFDISEPESTQIECSDRLVLYNMQLLEAFLFAIDEVNRDAAVLPDLKLAGLGFDSCSSKKRVGKEVGNFYSGTVDYRPGYNPNRITIAGMIGGSTSDTTQAISNTLTNLDLATISYGATSTIFSSTKAYPHVLRTVPSDEKQAAAMVNVLMQFEWNYISIVYSDDSYGNDILEQFRKASETSNICVAMTLVVSKMMSSPSAIDALIDSLQTNPHARVVLLLTSDLHTRSVLQAAERKEVTDVQWVGGDTWGSRDYVSQGAERTSLGAITIQFKESETTGFRDYYTSLLPYSNHRNPWWRNFWSDNFQCNVISGRDIYDTSCPFNSPSLAEEFTQAPEVTYVVNAVKALATGLHNAITELCPGVSNHLCSDFINNPDSFYDIVRTVSFTGADGVNFQFDPKGDGPAEYDILNFRPTEDGRLVHATIGTWIDGILTLTTPDLFRGGEQITLSESSTSCVGRCDECLPLPESARLVASLPGELQIPAVVGVHESTPGSSQTCGSLREAGIVNVEAILYAVKAINSDDTILKGVQLGTTVFDSCLSTGQGIRSLSSYLSRTGEFSEDNTWRHIAGIVAAEDQTVTRYLSDLSEQFEYVQVAYSSVNSSSSEFLMQTSQSLDQYFRAIQNILQMYGWNLVAVISDGRDVQHQQLAESIFSAREEIGVCVDIMQKYDSDNDASSIQAALVTSESNVAILVMSLSTAEDILTRMEIDRHMTFIIIDPYGPSPSVTLPSQLNGALIVSTSSSLDDFDNYITSLEAGENSDNPWFDEFIMTKYGCVLTGQNSRRCDTSDRIENSLASINAQNIIDSVYALARGIDAIKSEMCGIGSEGLCKAFFQVTPAGVKDILANQEFESEGGRTVTMRKGSAVDGFDIWNSNMNGEVSQVGSWEDGTLTIKNVYLEDTKSVRGTVKSSQTTCASVVNSSTLYQPSLEGQWFLVVVVLSAAGIIISVMFLFGVLIQRQSPQAQVYSVFLTIALLIFIICTFAQNALFYLTPSPLVCGVRRTAYSAVLTSAFLAVFLMTVRIYRILAREKRITGPRTLYINNKSQGRLFLWLSVITIIMVLQQWLLQRPAVVSDSDSVAYCQFMDGHYAISLLFMFVLMLATVFVSILAMCRSSTILSKEIWLGFICVISCIILVVAWIVLGIITDIFNDNSMYILATSLMSIALGYLLLFFFVPIRIFNLWRKHDPFSDSASVVSGEFRDSNRRERIVSNSSEMNGATGGLDNHTYDDPAAMKQRSESKM